jgi:hypothetical protein
MRGAEEGGILVLRPAIKRAKSPAADTRFAAVTPIA